ncbi:Protein of unknown function [Chishuiella changwenlii]|uniref:DUF4876 domain-containing protein n=1 Tax=Chishuiella changwenlii TaxID=1434701 RepID=A0A1M6V2N1_9FLAO|nr:DUF4876 domain-containing protein [Chishuiella changwenlii]GGF02010.1 DUF4876 domain-containing protein [Chishuiella changwenlii]SHK75713.1 Protein of unknown function [Chishuiella changwenlii]
MKKRILLLSFLALSATYTLVSCSNDDDFGTEVVQKSTLTVSFKGDNIKTYKLLEIEAVELNTGAKTTNTVQDANAYSLELPKGSYKITINGTVVTTENEEVKIGGSASVDITAATANLSVSLYIKQFNEDFIIEEAFYTGVKTPEGKNYNSSRYFKITNNTDKVLYADKLILGQSEFVSQVDNNVTPYNRDKAFAVKGVMVLPGNGTDYPVQPGDFIVIADNAINHNSVTSTAFDLSKADFEFPSENPSLGQVDNPAVPNVTVIYSQMNFNMFFLHSSGVESYVLARFPEGETSTTFLEKYKYSYEYVNSAGNITKKSTYEIPNTWIVDGMNNSVTDRFAQLLLGSSIDAGWASVGTWNSADRLGKSVRRHTLGKMENGKNVYKDTNNSTVDFIRSAEPSLKNGIVH